MRSDCRSAARQGDWNSFEWASLTCKVLAVHPTVPKMMLTDAARDSSRALRPKQVAPNEWEDPLDEERRLVCDFDHNEKLVRPGTMTLVKHPEDGALIGMNVVFDCGSRFSIAYTDKAWDYAQHIVEVIAGPVSVQ